MNGAAGLPLPAEAPDAPLRTDAAGIFAVLAISGFSQLFGGPAATFVQRELPPVAVLLWAGTLICFGTLGLVAIAISRHRLLLGLGLEVAARVALGIGAIVEAIVVYAATGLVGRFVILVFLGIAAILLVGAALITRRLLRQRRALRTLAAVVDLQTGRERPADEQEES